MTLFHRIFTWFARLFAGGRTVKELAHRIDVPIDSLKNIDLSYRQVSIPKKSGKRRKLNVPNNKLKTLQRRILHRLLKKLRTHPLATGFKPGVSFVDNARCHQSQAVVIRIDLVNFFPSIKRSTIESYFRRIGWGRGAARLLCDLTTHNDCLPQGAPTSPMISNLVCYFMDIRFSGFCEEHDAVYTRYADDITISSHREDADVHELLALSLRAIRRAGFQPHFGKKFDVRRSHQRQMVTGLVVNDRANLTREKRRWLRAVEHRKKLVQAGGYLGPRPTLTDEQLAGWHSLQNMIDNLRIPTE